MCVRETELRVGVAKIEALGVQYSMAVHARTHARTHESLAGAICERFHDLNCRRGLHSQNLKERLQINRYGQKNKRKYERNHEQNK